MAHVMRDGAADAGCSVDGVDYEEGEHWMTIGDNCRKCYCRAAGSIQCVQFVSFILIKSMGVDK